MEVKNRNLFFIMGLFRRESMLTGLIKPVLVMLALLLGSEWVGAQITIDATSSALATSGTTMTISHTTGNGDFRLMLVGVSTRNRFITVGTAGTETANVTYDGDPMVFVGTQPGDNDAITYIFSMVGPPTGTADVVVIFASALGGDNNGIIGIMTFTDVDPNNPLGTYSSIAGNNSAPSLTINSTDTDQLIFNVLTVTDDVTLPITLNSGQTEQWELLGSNRPTGGGYTKTGVASSTTISYTLSQNRKWSLSGVAINEVPVTDLQITKTVSDPVPYIGQTITFTITANNDGSDNSPNTIVEDLLPSGYTYSSHTASSGTYNASSGEWSIGTLNASTTATLTIEAVVNPTGDYSNTGTISGDVNDTIPGNNSASVSITVCEAGGIAPLFSD